MTNRYPIKFDSRISETFDNTYFYTNNQDDPSKDNLKVGSADLQNLKSCFTSDNSPADCYKKNVSDNITSIALDKLKSCFNGKNMTDDKLLNCFKFYDRDVHNNTLNTTRHFQNDPFNNINDYVSTQDSYKHLAFIIIILIFIYALLYKK